MSRSVSTHRHAVAIHYQTFTCEDVNFVDEEWQDFIEDLQENVLPQIFPSLRKCDRWQDREDHVIMENSRFEISVSEYNGIVAICLAPRDNDNALDCSSATSAGRNFNRKLAKFYSSTTLHSQGRFSNGEQMFTLANEPHSCITSKEGRLW